MTTFLSNHDIYTTVVRGIVPQARERLWIATAGIKDMFVRQRDSVWRGEFYHDCGRRDFCGDPVV